MLRVLAAGALATIQDLGRRDALHLGVPLSGAMDRVAHEIANRLVGNPLDAACVEITLGGGMFEVLEPCVIAATGGDLGFTLNGSPAPMWTSLWVRPRQVIAFEGRRSSGRASLALAGGVAAPLILGSRSTYVPGRFGGIEGRGLQPGDLLRPHAPPADLLRHAGRRWAHPPSYSTDLRVLPVGQVPPGFEQPWRVSATSNRIGLRLEGEPLVLPSPRDVASFGVFPGVIQLPPDGLPIVLMADAQPTGGYPVIGAVIQADLHHAAQLLPGDAVRLIPVCLDEAIQALRALRQWLASPVDSLDEDNAALAGAFNPALLSQ